MQLMPKPTDLSYYNWETQTSTSNSSPNFQVPITMPIRDWDTFMWVGSLRSRPSPLPL